VLLQQVSFPPFNRQHQSTEAVFVTAGVAGVVAVLYACSWQQLRVGAAILNLVCACVADRPSSEKQQLHIE